MTVDSPWECVVVGGGAAGLSAAVVLGRSRRRTLLLDGNRQSNRAAPAIGGLLGHDGRPPRQLYELGRQELARYPTVEYRHGWVSEGAAADGGHCLALNTGETVYARRVLLATGMQYEPPNIPGLRELWGTSVFQCPFCHGWEMRDQRLAALANGGAGVHAALMLRGWSDDVMLLTDGATHLSAPQVALLEAAGVRIDQRRIASLDSADERLTDVVFANGDRLARDGLLVEAPLRQHSTLAQQLGAAAEPGPLAADSLAVDSLYRTSAPTVFAAGDVCTEQPHVAGAVAAGSQAAMIIVQSLLADEFGLPYPP